MALFSKFAQSRSQLRHSTAAGSSTLQESTTQADGPASIAANLNTEPSSIGKGQNLGIKVLYDGGAEACVDIVFVHGLTGNAYDTWLHKETGVHWPSDLLKHDLPDTRILSYGYDADFVNLWKPASISRLSNHAENLVRGLVRKRDQTGTETRKIFFVAHSLGGLVTECALGVSRHNAEEHLRQIERCTTGIAFLGVPHCGADLASWGKFGAQLLSVLKQANQEIIGVLKPGSEMLREVEKNFHSILRLRKGEKSEISVTSFYEEFPVVQVGEIVALHSAEIKGYSCFGIHANHMDMTKFPVREDPGYDSVLGELQRWKKTANKMAVVDPQSAHVQWKVPRVNTLYTGRRELGERLAKVFSFDPFAPPSEQRVFVIIGIGGTGKSEVCAKYAHDHEKEYWGIFWLDGSSVTTAEQGLIDIGRQCCISEPSSTVVKSWLASKGPSNGHRWLLVIDNADILTIDYSEYMPPGKGGDILLTTRNPECAIHHTVGSETLHGLELELALNLLLKASLLPESQWEENRKAATVVIEILGSHTLAIIQAGAYVRQKLCSLEEYPLIFQKQKKVLLQSHSTVNISTYGNVYKTFEVSAEYLKSSGLSQNLDALNLLHILAFMHNDVSETLFQRAADYATTIHDLGESQLPFRLSVCHIPRLPEYMQQGWSSKLQDHQRWRKARAVLQKLSLITLREINDSVTISMHALTHDWARERQDHQDQCTAWQSAATILAMSCQGQFGFAHFFVYLQSHVRVCVSYEIQKFTNDISATEAAQILIQFACVLYHTGDDRSLISLVPQTLLRLENRGSVSLAIREELKTFRARVAGKKGNPKEALLVLRELVEDRAQRLSEDHANRLDSEHELACAYRDNGQTNEAVELLKHVVKVREKLAEDDHGRLLSQHELASAYLANGQTNEAVELLEHVVKLRENLAEDHPDELASQHELARAYLENDQFEEAMKLLEHIVKVGENLAEDHPSRLTSQHELASAYLLNSQIDKAIDLLEYVVKVQEQLAEDHPDRLASQHELAGAYLANSQIDEAMKLLEYVVKVQEQLAEDHPDRLASQHELARAYNKNGQIDEAIELFEHVVKIRSKKLAEGHPERLASQHELAFAYKKNGRIDESIELFEHVVKIRRKTLAEDHSDRLTSEHNFATAYIAKGRIDEAVGLLEHVVNIWKGKLAEDHPNRVASRRALAEAYEAKTQTPKA
ncbi:hypothetical protein BDR22DRAFT_885950 [Usnea florida]